MGNLRLVAAALCATLVLCGCTVFGVAPPGSSTSQAVRPSLPYTSAQEPELASAADLPFDKRGQLKCDGTLLGFGSEHEDLGKNADLRFTSPMLVTTAGTKAALPVFLMKDSKIYNESGERITCAQFCANMFMSDEQNPIRKWHLTIRLDDADRMTLVKATPVASK